LGREGFRKQVGLWGVSVGPKSKQDEAGTLETGLRIHTERTPNPCSVKWVVGQTVLEGGRPLSFEPGTPREISPLAARIFAVPGVTGVLLGSEVITVSKAEEVGWRELGQAVTRAIRAWAAAGEDALGVAYQAPPQAPDDEIEARIRGILQTEIAPYVEQDGGEIDLVRFRDGVVEVALRGACVGCPSSTVTLKMGVEARLREEIPEIVSVVAV
jgi:Fe-S cluster biogenesis protein NfuA